MCPSKANCRAPTFSRNRPCASSASCLGSCCPSTTAVQHMAPRDPEHIAGYRAQLDIGVLQHLLDPIGKTGQHLPDFHSHPRQVSQTSNDLWRNKTRL